MKTYRQRSNQAKQHYQCPNCGSEKAVRVKRSPLDKLVSALTFGRMANEKFYCKLCDTSFYTRLKPVDKLPGVENLSPTDEGSLI